MFASMYPNRNLLAHLVGATIFVYLQVISWLQSITDVCSTQICNFIYQTSYEFRRAEIFQIDKQFHHTLARHIPCAYIPMWFINLPSFILGKGFVNISGTRLMLLICDTCIASFSVWSYIRLYAISIYFNRSLAFLLWKAQYILYCPLWKWY